MAAGKLHSFFPLAGSLVRGLSFIHVSWPVGAAGAVGEITGEGVTSVVRDSEGLFTITLDDRYQAIRQAIPTVVSPVLEDIHAQVVAIDEEAKTVQIRCIEIDGAGDPQVEDPLEDDVVSVSLLVTEQYPGARA